MTKPRIGSVFITGGLQRKALAAALALKRRGVEVTVGDPSHLALSLWSLRVDHRALYPDPEQSEERFIDWMVRRMTSHPVDLLFPTGGEGEINAIHKHRAAFDGIVKVGLSPAHLFEVTEDKGTLYDRAVAAGVAAPTTWQPATPIEAMERAESYTYPALIKPRRGSGGRGIVHVADADALRKAYPEVAARHARPLIQEYVPSAGSGLGVAALYDFQARPVALFSYKRLREFPIGAGPSTFTESTRDPELLEAARKILDELKWQGLAMVEFRRDARDGKVKLIEVNGRFWGSARLPIVSGLNFPWLYFQLMTTGRVDPPADYREGVRCRWLFPGDFLHFLTNRKRWKMDPPFFQFFGKDLYYDPPILPDPFPLMGQVAWAAWHALHLPTLRKYLHRR